MKPLSQIAVETTEGADINLSPLIDMVFLLLIFFMVTTVFVEETGVEVRKPSAITADQLRKNSIMIAITQQGDVVYGGRTIGVNGVRGLVARTLNVEDRPVVLFTDKAVRAGLVVDVIDECKLAGAKQVSIATERE